MSWWSKAIGKMRPAPGMRAGDPAPEDDFWYSPVAAQAASGVPVTSETALRLAPVYACVKVLAETIASLPLLVYQRRPDGGKTRAPDHPLFDILHRQPNAWQTAYEFWQMLVWHVALRGNGYAEIVPGRRGPVDQLIPLHPDSVRVMREASGRLSYEIKPRATQNDAVGAVGKTRVLMQGEVLHIRGLSSNGIVGFNPIEVEREAIGMGIAAQDYAARFWRNDSRPGGVLEHPGQLSEEAERAIRDSFVKAQTGVHRHKPAVLAEGMKFNPIGVTNKDAQFLEIRQFSAVDVARIWRMQPHKIGILDRATFSNIEQQSIEFVVDTITPWLIRIEQAISRDLILAPKVFFAEFLVEGLLRGDSAARASFYNTLIQAGVMTRNEARIRENLNPLPGLDAPLQPLNMVPASPERAIDMRELIGARGNGHGRLSDYESGLSDAPKDRHIDAVTNTAR